MGPPIQERHDIGQKKRKHIQTSRGFLRIFGSSVSSDRFMATHKVDYWRKNLGILYDNISNTKATQLWQKWNGTRVPALPPKLNGDVNALIEHFDMTTGKRYEFLLLLEETGNKPADLHDFPRLLEEAKSLRATHLVTHLSPYEHTGSTSGVIRDSILSLTKQLPVAFVCARYTEAVAVRAVLERDKPGQEKVTFTEAYTKERHQYHTAQFKDKDGHVIKVIVITAEQMGAGNYHLVRSVLDEFNPRCLLMTGMCAALRSEVELGDVIIADGVTDVNEGKVSANATLVRSINPFRIDNNLRSMIWEINNNIKSWVAPLVPLRPAYSRLYRKEAVLRILFDANDHKASPEDIEQELKSKFSISMLPAEWDLVVNDQVEWEDTKEADKSKKTIKHEGGAFVLKPGIQADLQTKVVLRRQLFPHTVRSEPKGFLVPIAVDQSAVRSDLNEQKWRDLATAMAQRKMIALEMEGVALYSTADNYNQAHPDQRVKVLLVKGVTDFADAEKDDTFQQYAAEISAAWAYAFLWRYAVGACH